jgi:hypothetical protein
MWQMKEDLSYEKLLFSSSSTKTTVRNVCIFLEYQKNIKFNKRNLQNKSKTKNILPPLLPSHPSLRDAMQKYLYSPRKTKQK